MTIFAIAGIQLDASAADNLTLMSRQITKVRKRFPWVQMVLFGELAAFGPQREKAEPMPGPTEEHFCALAKCHQLWLVPGSIYELKDGHIYNTAPVINPQGEVVTRYRKMFPFLPYETGVAPGEEFCVFDIPEVGRFGLSICYDIWVPETIRALAWLGAEVILHPTLTNTIDRDVELSIVRASAVTNQCYILDINSSGELAVGKSLIVGPEGDVIHQADQGHEIMPVQVDLERVRRSRVSGVHGLGQPLKSFRDSRHHFPQYQAGVARSQELAGLGPLVMPGRVGAL